VQETIKKYDILQIVDDDGDDDNNNNNNSIQFLYLRACQQRIAYNRQALNIQIRSNSKTKPKYYK
jgi:hypothetical protein